MRYILALLCPPLAMARARKPLRAIASALIVVAAAFTWSSGLGFVLLAVDMAWACRVAGDSYAEEELSEFLRQFSTPGAERP